MKKNQKHTQILNPIQTALLIERSNGKFIGITFKKRTNGMQRIMNFRLGVNKFTNGGELKYKPIEHTLITVWDRNKKGYRSIPLDNIEKINIGGDSFIVSP
jgi:hypothetical protein